MRVLELLSSPVWTGPAEPMTSVARQLARRGHHVEVAVDGRREGDLRERLAAEGFPPRIELALSTKARPPRVPPRPRPAAARGPRLRRGPRQLLARSRARGPGGGAGDRTRVVRTVHSSRSLADRGLQGWIHRRTDGLLAVCEAHAAILRERFGIPAERVRHRPGRRRRRRPSRPRGPTSAPSSGIAPDAPVAGIVSRVKPDRRHAELVDAFGRVASRLPEARLVIVGRGEGLPDLRAHVERSGLADRVVFAGYRRGPELAAAYRTFDVKVLLAEGNDGTCRALLEGMASGRPGVAWAFGAPAESIVHGETGLLRPAGRRGGARRRHRRRPVPARTGGRAMGAGGAGPDAGRSSPRRRGAGRGGLPRAVRAAAAGVTGPVSRCGALRRGV